jgi:hypothetical protein
MDPPLQLTDLLRAWRSRWLTLLGGIIAGATLGLSAWLLVPAPFEATTVVQVESADPEHVDMAAEEAIATSRRVTAEALATMDKRAAGLDRLEATSSATAVPTSHVLHIAHSAPSPRAAARGADALAQAYLAARAVDAGRSDADESVATVTARIVDPARVPDSPTGPGRAAWCLAGALLGLLAAVPVASRSPAARAS